MTEKSLELKVGIFALIALSIFVTFILLIGDFKDWNNRYNIRISFGFVDGVKVGSPVRFAGLDVGQVKEVTAKVDSATGDTRIEVLARLQGHIKVPRDSKIWVNTLGLLGEKYIEIFPGKNYSDVLRPDELTRGNDSVAMNEVMASASSAINDLSKIVSKMNKQEGTIFKLLYEDTIYKDLEALVADIKSHPWKLFYRTKEAPACPVKTPKSNFSTK